MAMTDTSKFIVSVAPIRFYALSFLPPPPPPSVGTKYISQSVVELLSISFSCILQVLEM